MKKLRLLQLSGVKLDGDFEYVSRNLRWLSWNGFPLSYIPRDFYLGNLVSIELENSNIKVVWKWPQVLILFFACNELFSLFIFIDEI
jgi:hypothetical protein